MKSNTDIMHEFVDSVHYLGRVRNWRDVPETGTSDDEPLDNEHDRARQRENLDVAHVGPTKRVDRSLTRTQQQRVDIILARYVPEPLRRLAPIFQCDLGQIHGEYDEQLKRIRLNPRTFVPTETFGDPPVDHLTRTLLHEVCHAWWWMAGFEDDAEWLKLSAWEQRPDTPTGKARYIETRPGWPAETSLWCYSENAWFTRPYAAKTPSEDFADCGAWLLIGWRDAFQSGGQAKRDSVEAKLRALEQ